MNKTLIREFLEAYATGDAWGKVTEYCTREQIEAAYTAVDTLLPPEKSIAHQDLFYGQVTDDTEQNVYLIREYSRRLRVDPYETAMALLLWVTETDAASKYMGPNSLKALNAIRGGEDINTAGVGGTTCGGMMRVPAAFLFSDDGNLEQNIVACLKPTHYTSVALEAAVCYGFALREAARGGSMETILEAACEGARLGRLHGSAHRTAGVAPSCEARLRFLYRTLPTLPDEAAVKAFLYDVIGATLASCDVCACAFGLFFYAGGDVNRVIRLAAELGGDTDTIGCLAAGLSTLYAGGHNIDPDTIRIISENNKLDFEEMAAMITKSRGAMYGEESL